jgi:hypothetical protein
MLFSGGYHGSYNNCYVPSIDGQKTSNFACHCADAGFGGVDIISLSKEQSPNNLEIRRVAL